MGLKLFLSGAVTFEGPSEPSKSLGGYPSSTEVQNGQIGNLFPNISLYTIQLNRAEVRAIVLYNDGATTLTGLDTWLIYPQSEDSDSDYDNIAEFELGYAVLESDGCGGLRFPSSVTNPNALPYNVTFNANAVGQANALSLPDLEADQYLGLWIKRVLKDETQTPLSNDELEAILDEEVVLSIVEDITLQFIWD